MRRRARACVTSTVLAVALAGGLAGCTGSSDSGGDGADSKPGSGSSSPAPAPPGKYRTLPEPCGAVSQDMLKKMLPEAADSGSDGSDDDGPGPYEGEAAVTYDTDRRAGCAWESMATIGNRHLSVDFERVVSYDPAVSDDKQTEFLYGERADKAGVDVDAPVEENDGGQGSDSPDPESEKGDTGSGTDDDPDPDSGTGTGGDTGGDTSGDGVQDGAGDASGDASGDPASPSPSTEETLPSRNLDGIGEAAFIDDKLVSGESGRATHRDVTLVFRTENVLVSVEYTLSVTDERRTPDSAELQEHAQNLARQLAGKFNDN